MTVNFTNMAINNHQKFMYYVTVLVKLLNTCEKVIDQSNLIFDKPQIT